MSDAKLKPQEYPDCPVCGRMARTRANVDAIAAWNTRPQHRALVEALKIAADALDGASAFYSKKARTATEKATKVARQALKDAGEQP